MADIAPLEQELAQIEHQLAEERERRFLDSLTEGNREFVRESEKLRVRMLIEMQRMLTETGIPQLRRAAAEWVAAHAVDVAERNALVTQMRVRFFQTDVEPIRLTIEYLDLAKDTQLDQIAEVVGAPPRNRQDPEPDVELRERLRPLLPR